METTPYTIEVLIAEADTLRINRFDYDYVWRLGMQMREEAARINAPVAIEIAHGSDVVFTTLLPGATPDNLDWTRRKRAVAQRFQRGGLLMRLEAERDGYDFNRRWRLPEADYCGGGGGFPLLLKDGTLVGTIGVSGLTDVEDHRLIAIGVAAAERRKLPNRLKRRARN